jgi:hypothetical protein
MALFTDANVVTSDDLQAYEASLTQVATLHGINVDSKIALASSAVADKVMFWLLNAGAADPQTGERQNLGLSTIVITPSLKRWLCFEALAKFFGEAYNVQLNTRFQGKWTEYQSQAVEAGNLALAMGLSGVFAALPRPDLPAVSVQEGTTPAQSVFLQVTWVDRNGSESAPSPINGQILPANATFVVAPQEGAMVAPPAAVGWNVYGSSTADSLTLQTAEPVSVGSTWEFPSSGWIQGQTARNGQKPDYLVPLSRRLHRG